MVAFGRPGVRLPEKPTSGLQYNCSDQEFRLFVLTTAAPIDREEKTRRPRLAFASPRVGRGRSKFNDNNVFNIYYFITVIIMILYVLLIVVLTFASPRVGRPSRSVRASKHTCCSICYHLYNITLYYIIV